MWSRAGRVRSTPTATSSPASRPRRKARSGERHHPAPELRRLAGVDVVFARETELAIGPDAIDGEACAERLDGVPFANQQRLNARCNQQAPRGIDSECPELDAVAIDILDQGRLAGFLIDGVDRHVVLAAGEN